MSAMTAQCTHPRLRATDYDETYHWVVVCKDCQWTGTMTQGEWRRRLLAHGLGTTKVKLEVAPDHSGRVDLKGTPLRPDL
jgi:hypothetical protein